MVLQDQPHLIAIDLIASALAAETSKEVPSGTDPIALFEFGVLVCVFVYFFKTKKNRDALFKFINDMHWARSPDHAPPPAISKGCKVLIHGVVSKPELNGCKGRVAGCCNEERQRWPVRVMPNIGAYEEMLLKLANIMLESSVPATAVPAAAAAASIYSYYCCYRRHCRHFCCNRQRQRCQ